ncbi:hypothetical protein M569_02332 [Genlisea aurea]|uniref:Enhancer of mRNA-decapping protein 4 WD40 repeat region domain-containing protein n=1 Tax=Genlisea aurea TaxID=192259 RepID=S8CZD3_9LAMI|nr:hypothetical protein M569_02332 [Genlisea aurea]
MKGRHKSNIEIPAGDSPNFNVNDTVGWPSSSQLSRSIVRRTVGVQVLPYRYLRLSPRLIDADLKKMASPGNPNQPPAGGIFDVQTLFNPSTPPLASSSPNPPNFISNVSNAVKVPGNFPSAPFPPPSGSYPPQAQQFSYHPVYTAYSSPPPPLPEFLPPQRSLSYPTRTLQPQGQPGASPIHPNFQNPSNTVNPNNHGAHLMALLSAPPSVVDISQQPAMHILPTSSAGSDSPVHLNLNNLPSAPGLVASHPGPELRMPSSKLPKGRHLVGDNLVYDIDVRLPGEVQPQLEVTPITKYGSDPGLVLGRQIAVNKTYICYGLKLGNIRVLNINTALRSLLKGLTQRVTDMAFFAEDVPILASASMDGRVYVWKITEGPDEEDKPQITGRIIVAIQVTGEAENAHPRVCWHCYKQEVLIVGIGRHVLKIDTTKLGKGETFSADEPVKCPIGKLIEGVQLVGTHDGEVTDLSMCRWMTTRLASASTDGTIKIWEDRKPQPIAVLRPHDGHPVNSVTFLAAPHHPDHIILFTGGPMNRELKIWVSASEEGWLLPSDVESWWCTQTLELRSSEAEADEAFFNQVIALPQAGLLLLANAKRNAIYAVHLGYGPNPAATRMDYIAEFTVAMPILSFTGTSELLPHGEAVVQVYCVQTLAIQQYALDLSQCLPPPGENLFYEKSDLVGNPDGSDSKGVTDVETFSGQQSEISLSNSALLASSPKIKYSADSASSQLTGQHEFPSIKDSIPAHVSDGLVVSSIPLSSLSLSPGPTKILSRNPVADFEPEFNAEAKIVEYSVDRKMDVGNKNASDVASLDGESRSDESGHYQDDSVARGQQSKFKHPTHLVTPSEILKGNSASEPCDTTETKVDVETNIQDVGISNDARMVEVEVKVVDDAGTQHGLQTAISDSKEKSFYSEESYPGIEMARECHEVLPEAYVVHETQQTSASGEAENISEPSPVEDIRGSTSNVTSKVIDSSATGTAEPSSSHKNKKQKGKNPQGSASSSQMRSPIDSTDSSIEPFVGSNIPIEAAFAQIISMQETLNQIVALQKDMQKQMASLVAASVTKEVKRLEMALGKSMEKAVKSHSDALLARVQEESSRQEKGAKDHMQQLANMISNCLNKDLPLVTDKTVKKELSSMAQSLSRSITPVVEKALSTSVAEGFQKGVGDKGVNQLEKSVSSKLEATVAKHIQIQFQTSGKQALQETLKSSIEASVVPAFEMSCRAMFEQVDAAFQKGMIEHTAAAHHQLEAAHSPLAVVLRDALNSASSITQTLSGEILEGQRKLLALAANSKSATSSLAAQLNNGPLVALHEKLEVTLDPTKELTRLIGERKYDEAFTDALQRSDVGLVSWLCTQVDLAGILLMSPVPLSSGVLLSLLQQLGCDLSNDTPRKLMWMREIVSAMNPGDPVIVMHARPILEQVYHVLNHQRGVHSTAGAEQSNIRLIMHAINSILMTSK